MKHWLATFAKDTPQEVTYPIEAESARKAKKMRPTTFIMGARCTKSPGLAMLGTASPNGTEIGVALITLRRLSEVFYHGDEPTAK